MDLSEEFFKLLKIIGLDKKLNFNKFAFSFLCKINKPSMQFKININTKCLVLSPYPAAETKGLGGLIAQHPKNFEVLCFTNGSSLVKDVSLIESVSIKKKQFAESMKLARVKGFKIFDIEDNTLKKNYGKFNKIDISEADIIFVPNIFDKHPDSQALLSFFIRLLREKEYKKNLTIAMYESDTPLCSTDYFTDISSIIEMKKEMLKVYYPEEKYPALAEQITGLNKFRAISVSKDYTECFMTFTPDEFISVPVM